MGESELKYSQKKVAAGLKQEGKKYETVLFLVNRVLLKMCHNIRYHFIHSLALSAYVFLLKNIRPHAITVMTSPHVVGKKNQVPLG